MSTAYERDLTLSNSLCFNGGPCKDSSIASCASMKLGFYRPIMFTLFNDFFISDLKESLDFFRID